MSRMWGFIVGIFALALSATSANASVVYTYIGNDFTSADAPYSTSDYVSISLTFSAALGDNLPYSHVVPTSFSISNGLVTITSANDLAAPNSYGTPFFAVSTDNNGAILNWNVADIQAGPGQYIDSRNFSGSILDVTLLTPDAYGNEASVDDPGTWTVTPLPAALPLFATGLGVICVLAWRRKRKTEQFA
jgi:hypothetical protein